MLVVLLEKTLESFKIIQDTCCYVQPRIDNCILAEFFTYFYFFPSLLETREVDGSLEVEKPFKTFA